jgi:hypothetical protein
VRERPDYFDRLNEMARSWLSQIEPVLPQLSPMQLSMLGAMVVGDAPFLSNTALPIPWDIHANLIALLRESDRFDKLALYGSSGSTVRAEDFPFRLVRQVLDEESISIDQARISPALRDVRAFIEQDHVEVVVGCELFGYWADGPVEISESLGIHLNSSKPSFITLMMLVPQGRYCLEARAVVGLEFVEHPSSTQTAIRTENLEKEGQLYRDVGLAIEVLMILQPGVFTPGPVDIRYENWMMPNGGQRRQARPVYPSTFERFDFNARSCKLLQTLFGAAREADRRNLHNILIALRRFQQAQLRGSDEDKLIDLMIAAEALFLNDGTDELSYRLATRAALFLAGSRDKRVRVFQSLRTAYRVRSAVVHGTRVSRQDVSGSVKDVEILLRAALQRALLFIAANRTHALAKWDDMAFLGI